MDGWTRRGVVWILMYSCMCVCLVLRSRVFLLLRLFLGEENEIPWFEALVLGCLSVVFVLHFLFFYLFARYFRFPF